MSKIKDQFVTIRYPPIEDDPEARQTGSVRVKGPIARIMYSCTMQYIVPINLC